MQLLLLSALFPIVILCFYIYKKDPHEEPIGLLVKMFGFGSLTVFPILILELTIGNIFTTSDVYDFMPLFINTFISVGIIEEGFKWLVVKKIGYDNNEFDEIYDIIVYSVFVSLGFACVENVLYVVLNGFTTAFMRAITAVPGHTSFAVIMGYFLSKAKVGEMNQSVSVMNKNLLHSITIPALIHSFYDSILLYITNLENISFIGFFYLFLIVLFVICVIIVNRISKIQNNVLKNVYRGNIVYRDGSISMNTMQINKDVLMQAALSECEDKDISSAPNYCPICGKSARGDNYCGFCGYKLKE